MKFRVKYRNVSRTAVVDDESEVKLSRLQEVVSLTFSDLLHGSFYLSLNKRDPLGNGDDSLRGLGLVSGDLLHVVSTDPDNSQVDQQQPPTQQPINKSLGLPNTPTVSSNTNEQPSTSQQGLTPRDTDRIQPSCARDDEMEAESIQSEAVYPVDLAVVNDCLNEPRLCSEATVGKMPALLSELYSEAHCRFLEEALCLVLHVLMLESGYQPTASKDMNNEIVTESDSGQTERQTDSGLGGHHESGVYPNSSWRQQAPAFYCLEYTHPSSGPTVYTVTAVPMGASLVVHGQIKIEDRVEKCKCQLKTSEFVKELTPEANTCYQNLPKVSRVFKDCVCLPLLQKYREAMNLVPLHGIQALSNELKLKILSHLDVVSLLKMSQVCKEFQGLSADRFLWRRLFLSYFGNRAQNDLNQNWRELYRKEYKQRKQHRKWLSRMKGPLHRFIPADPYTHRVPPMAPFRPGMIGGDYDLYPQFHGVPNPLFGRRAGQPPEMRPRFDPFAPDQNFFPGPGGGMRDGQGGGSRFLSGSRSGNAWLSGGPRMF